MSRRQLKATWQPDQISQYSAEGTRGNPNIYGLTMALAQFAAGVCSRSRRRGDGWLHSDLRPIHRAKCEVRAAVRGFAFWLDDFQVYGCHLAVTAGLGIEGDLLVFVELA
jgi:hypothetical protein